MEKEPSSDSEPRTVTEVTQEDAWEREERITASETVLKKRKRKDRT